jgi:hypothetical protein
MKVRPASPWHAHTAGARSAGLGGLWSATEVLDERVEARVGDRIESELPDIAFAMSSMPRGQIARASRGRAEPSSLGANSQTPSATAASPARTFRLKHIIRLHLSLLDAWRAALPNRPPR